ncbi:MAG: tetratricopeptide repeat protein [Magnetococcales bacterium]|nr:tetratricopeptide repeat protein [Magnetococcales bacterium]
MPPRREAGGAGSGAADTLALALAAQQSGRWQEAENHYRSLMRRWPREVAGYINLALLLRQHRRFPEAISLLKRGHSFCGGDARLWRVTGLVLHEAGQAAEALAAYGKALSLDSSQASLWNDYGDTLLSLGRMPEAEEAFRRAIALNGRFAPAWNNLGEVLRRGQRVAEALTCYGQAVAFQPEEGLYHSHRGVALTELGQFDAALQCHDRALERLPESPRVHNNRGFTLWKAQHLQEAEAAFRTALAQDPSFEEALSNLAQLLLDRQRPAEAVFWLEKALLRNPHRVEVQNGLGLARQEQGDLVAACEAFETAMRLDVRHAGAATNLGNCLGERDRWEESLACYREAVTRQPDFVQGWVNLGKGLHDAGCFEEALSAYDRAIALEPDNAKARLNRAFTLLLQGRYPEGWRDWEYRWGDEQFRPFRKYQEIPLWQGQALSGRRLLLHAEQGLGDTLQMVRFLPQLACFGGEVVLECQPPLREILQGIPGCASVFVARESPPECAFQLPLMSLPAVLGVTPETIPAAEGYLGKRPEGATWPRPRRIGLCWQGNPGHRNDRRRSIPFVVLQPLFQLADCEWVSLQAGPAAAEADRHSWAAGLQRPSLEHFRQTRSVLGELDLLISVDTSVAHLAGAMAVPVWTLLTWVPDWRWGLGSEETPWYRSMRLIRQPQRGNWPLLIDTVVRRLEIRAAEGADP